MENGSMREFRRDADAVIREVLQVKRLILPRDIDHRRL
jgi:hypothetical protein